MKKWWCVFKQGGAGALSEHPAGQSLAEYGLILGLVAVVSISALQTLGGSLSTQIGDLAASLQGSTVALSASPASSQPYSASTSTSEPTGGNDVVANNPNPDNPASSPISSPESPQPEAVFPTSSLSSSTGDAPASSEPTPSLADTGDAHTQPEPVSTAGSTPADNAASSGSGAGSVATSVEQSAWANAEPGCMGCTNNMTGNWGW